jgi:hypothetical protein
MHKQDRTNTRPAVHQAADELLRRAVRPATTPTRLIAAGIKHGSGPIRLITPTAVTA